MGIKWKKGTLGYMLDVCVTLVRWLGFCDFKLGSSLHTLKYF